MPRLQVRTFPSRITCAWGANMARTFLLHVAEGARTSPGRGRLARRRVRVSGHRNLAASLVNRVGSQAASPTSYRTYDEPARSRSWESR
jgi:hypothetical protein